MQLFIPAPVNSVNKLDNSGQSETGGKSIWVFLSLFKIDPSGFEAASSQLLMQESSSLAWSIHEEVKPDNKLLECDLAFCGEE